MVFDFLKRKKEGSELKDAMKYGALMGDAQRGIADQEIMEGLGINPHMIEDEKLNTLLDNLTRVKNPQTNEVIAIDMDALSLRVMISKLIRSSWLDPIDATIGQLEAERFITRVEMNMNEDEYEYGGTNLLESISKIIQTAYSDAKDGRKAKLLKVTPRVFEIGMHETKKKEGGILP